MKSARGFVLVELLVVISILAILTVIGLVVYSGASAKARDATRKKDLHTIAQALEIYYQRNNRYPCAALSQSQDPDPWLRDNVFSGDPNCGGKPFDQNYIDFLPRDPRSNDSNFFNYSNRFGYAYWADSTVGIPGCPGQRGQYYFLLTRLENTQDPERNEVKNYRLCDGSLFFDHNTNTRYKQLFLIFSDQF